MKDYEDLSKKMEEQSDLLKVLIAEIRYMQIAMEARYLNKKTKESLDEVNKTKP